MKKKTKKTSFVEQKPFVFEMGCMASDIVSGFKGVITARCQYIDGEHQYQLVRRGTAKNPVTAEEEGRWFSEGRLQKEGTRIIHPFKY